MTDPANSPIYFPDGLTGTSRRAFNKVNVPYDPEKQNYEPMGPRVIENPRIDGNKGTWSYVAIPTPIGGKTRYLGVYLPYGYDPNRAEPYKTIYMQHGAQQDVSDWMNIGSVPVIMDNLKDVKKGEWYYSSVVAAQKLKIVNGKADGSFGINDGITRQDMAVMVYKTALLQNISLSGGSAITQFTDKASIASYAVQKESFCL